MTFVVNGPMGEIRVKVLIGMIKIRLPSKLFSYGLCAFLAAADTVVLSIHDAEGFEHAILPWIRVASRIGSGPICCCPTLLITNPFDVRGCFAINPWHAFLTSRQREEEYGVDR